MGLGKESSRFPTTCALCVCTCCGGGRGQFQLVTAGVMVHGAHASVALWRGYL